MRVNGEGRQPPAIRCCLCWLTPSQAEGALRLDRLWWAGGDARRQGRSVDRGVGATGRTVSPGSPKTPPRGAEGRIFSRSCIRRHLVDKAELPQHGARMPRVRAIPPRLPLPSVVRVLRRGGHWGIQPWRGPWLVLSTGLRPGVRPRLTQGAQQSRSGQAQSSGAGRTPSTDFLIVLLARPPNPVHFNH